MMDLQETFNIVYRGLEAQEFKRSVNTGGACMYRGIEGRKCAIGHLIPDEEYSLEIEGAPFRVLAQELDMFPGITGNEHIFLASLQMAHDSGRTPGIMRDNLADLADRYGLEIPHA